MNNKITMVYLSGLPGSGKDTQANMSVSRHPDAVRISPGEIMRAAKSPNHRFHDLLAPEIPIMEAGGITSPETAFVMINTVVRESIDSGKRTIFITGQPKNLDHLNYVKQQIVDLRNEGYDITPLFIFLAVRQKTAMGRVMGKEREGGRADDSEQNYLKRLEAFTTESIPAIREVQRLALEQPEEYTFRAIWGNNDELSVHDRIQQTIANI